MGTGTAAVTGTNRARATAVTAMDHGGTTNLRTHKTMAVTKSVKKSASLAARRVARRVASTTVAITMTVRTTIGVRTVTTATTSVAAASAARVARRVASVVAPNAAKLSVLPSPSHPSVIRPSTARDTTAVIHNVKSSVSSSNSEVVRRVAMYVGVL